MFSLKSPDSLGEIRRSEVGLRRGVSSGTMEVKRLTITDSNDFKQGMIDGVFSEFPTRNQYLTLSDSHIFTPELLGTLRGSFSRTHSIATSTIDLPSNLAFTPGQPMGGLGITAVDGYSSAPGTTPVELNQRIISASGDIFYSLSPHSLKFGTLLNFYRQFMSNNGGNSPRGNWTFPNLATFLTAAPTQFTVLTPGSSANRTYDYETAGLYLQDDWRATPTLTFNLGLRYDLYGLYQTRGRPESNFCLGCANATTGLPGKVIYEGDPEFDEAMRLGREYRESLRPPSDDSG